MSRHVQTFIRRLVVVQAIMLMLVMGATPAFADSDASKLKEIYGGTHKVALNPKKQGGGAFLRYRIPKQGVVTDTKSTKKSVATAWLLRDPDGKEDLLIVEGKKAGTAKISYTYNGKRYAATFVFKKWENPVSSLMIGSKQCAKRFKTGTGFPYSDIYGKTGNDLAGKKLKITAAKGWKLVSIKYISATGKLKTMKNGRKVPKIYNNVIVKLKNNKTGVIETIWMY